MPYTICIIKYVYQYLYEKKKKFHFKNSFQTVTWMKNSPYKQKSNTTSWDYRSITLKLKK